MDLMFSKLKGDRWLWIIIIFLSLWSLAAVYSSVGALAYKEGKGTEVYLIKHTLLIIGGFALMYISHKLNYQWYAGISKILMIITIPLLLYTLFFGNTVNEASRWVTIPIINQTFQTSDLAKLALITFLARTLTRKQENIKDVKKSFLPIMGSVCVIFALIAPANLSTALMLFGVSVLLLIIGRISIKQILYVCLAVFGVLVLVVLLGPRRQTYVSRVQTYLGIQDDNAVRNSDKSFQSDHAKIAIATGGLFGKGHKETCCRTRIPILFLQLSLKNTAP
jgi:cell division protein FtsW